MAVNAPNRDNGDFGSLSLAGACVPSNHMTGTPNTLADLWPTDGGTRTAIVIPDGGPAATFAQLAAQIAATAETLQRGGIRPGDPVAIVLGNGLDFLVTFLATTRARAIAAPLNPAYKAEEFRFYMDDAGARAVIVPPGEHAARQAAAELKLPIWEASVDGKGEARIACPAIAAAAPDLASSFARSTLSSRRRTSTSSRTSSGQR